MDSHLQLCTVGLVATVAWPVCWLCGATPSWLAWHFAFLAWAWVMLGGFAAALAISDMMERKLTEWALLPAQESPLAWVLVVVFVVGSIGATVWLLAPVRHEYQALRAIHHGQSGIDP